MKKALLLFVFGVVCLSAADIKFLSGGKSDYQIVLPYKMETFEIRKHVTEAAKRMQEGFREAAGAELPIVSEERYDGTHPGIFLAQTDYMHSVGLNTDDYEGFDYLIATRGRNIILSGANRHSSGWKWQNTHNCHTLGTVKAIVEFMRTYMHTEFLMPGVIGTSTPKAAELSIPENLTFKGHVKMKMCAGRNFDIMYDYANSNYGYGVIFSYGGHTYPQAVKKSEYEKTHPEYFALIHGKRDPNLGHLCISNPEVQELIFQNTLKHLDDGSEICELGQTDGYMACQCPNCANFGGTTDPAEQLWIFHRQLAERLKKERPGKSYLIIAYGPTWEPPQTFDTFPGNVYIEMCRYTRKCFDNWKRIKGIKGFTTYLYNWGEYPMPGLTPKRSANFCADQARFFNERNVIGIYRCGFGELFGMDSPGYYVYGNMLEHPELKPKELLKRFYESAFQEAAAPMRGFYETLQRQLDAFWLLENQENADDLTLGLGTGLPQDTRNLITFMYSPDVLDALELKLSGAEKVAHNPKVKKRLELVRAEFNYAKALARALHIYSVYRLSPNWTTFDMLATAVKERNSLIDSYYNEKGEMKPFPGWPEIRFLQNFAKPMLKTNGRLRATIGTPFGWNFDLMRSKKYLPMASKVSMNIKRREFTPGFDFEIGCWKDSEWQQLNEIQLGELTEHTRFKAIYDGTALRFAFECEMAAARQVKSLGHDGNVWNQDSLEISLDPYGQRLVSLHFICNPIEDSYYEGAIGLISDPLHPRYGKEDSSWNCKWDYVNERKGDTWRCIVSIPFESIGVPVPTPGVRWTMNVARDAFTKPNMKWNGELSLWSPNLETMSLSDNLSAFGDITFDK